MSDYEKRTGWMRNTPGWNVKKTMLDGITGKSSKPGKNNSEKKKK